MCFFPRGGQSKDGHWWVEDFDEQIALGALGRMDDILARLHDLDAGAHPDRIRELAYDTSGCGLCPYKAFGPTPGQWQCDSGGARPVPTDQVTEVSAADLLGTTDPVTQVA